MFRTNCLLFVQFFKCGKCSVRAWNYSALLWFGLKDGEGCLAGNWDGSILFWLCRDRRILGKLTKLVTAWISCGERIMALF